MRDNNIIGSKVYINISESEYRTKMDTTTIYTIVKVKDYGEVNDWCRHYVIRGADGNEKEVREVDAVFVPDYSLPEERMVNKYLADNEAYPDEVYHEGSFLCVSGTGDWKHLHGWLRNLMEYLGYVEVGENITEEDGSDWYGSIHIFYKPLKTN